MFYYSSFGCLGATPLCSGITPSGVQAAICSDRGKWVSHIASALSTVVSPWERERHGGEGRGGKKEERERGPCPEKDYFG